MEKILKCFFSLLDSNSGLVFATCGLIPIYLSLSDREILEILNCCSLNLKTYNFQAYTCPLYLINIRYSKVIRY